jgi:hypothetical protein
MNKLLRVPGYKGAPGIQISLNASINDAPYSLEHLDGVSICAVATQASGTLAGTLKLQASNNAFLDNTDNNANSGATWVDIPSSSISVSTATTQTVFWNLTDIFYEAIRIVWTSSTGTGTLTYFLIGKGQG